MSDESRLLALGGVKTPGNGFIFKNQVRDLSHIKRPLEKMGFVVCLLLTLIALLMWVPAFMLCALTYSVIFILLKVVSIRASRIRSVWISREGVVAEFTRSVSFHPWPWYSWIQWNGALQGPNPLLIFAGEHSSRYEITKEIAEAFEIVRGHAQEMKFHHKNPYSAKRELNTLTIVFLVIFAPLFIIPIFVLPLIIGLSIALIGAGAFAWAIVRRKPIDPFVSLVLSVSKTPEGLIFQTAAEGYAVGANDVVVMIMPRKPDDGVTLITREIPSPFVLTAVDAKMVRDHYSTIGQPIAVF